MLYGIPFALTKHDKFTNATAFYLANEFQKSKHNIITNSGL